MVGSLCHCLGFDMTIPLCTRGRFEYKVEIQLEIPGRSFSRGKGDGQPDAAGRQLLLVKLRFDSDDIVNTPSAFNRVLLLAGKTGTLDSFLSG